MARSNNYKFPFVAIEVADMETEAFKHLSKIAQLAYFYLDKYYWQSDRRNPVQMSQANLAKLMDCDEKTAQKVLTELDDYGFISRTHAGSMRGPIVGRSAFYRLNWQYDNEGNVPSRTWRKQSKILKGKKDINGGNYED